MASELLVNKITPESGNTLTLGESGDTISFASGVLPTLESLTITGDLTVDTDTLYVDSTNNRVGVGTTSPTVKLHIAAADDDGIFVKDSGLNSASPTVKVQGQRNDSNGSQCFAGGVVLQRYNSAGQIGSADTLGNIYFGGNHTDSSESNISYAASITGISDGDFNSVSDMPTAITFKTGDTGTALSTPNVGYGTERMRIDSSGHVIIPNGVTLGTSAGTYLASNTLDDYEEGTWTAEVYIGASSTGATKTGYYTKVGNLVTYTVADMNISKGALTGDIEIGGLPFTASNASGNLSNGIIRWGGLNTGGTIITFINKNGTRIIPQIYNATGGYVDDLDHLNITGSTFNFYTETGFYYTS